MLSGPQNRRILLVDDNEAIHEDFRRVLLRRDTGTDLDDRAAALFGSGRAGTPPALPSFELDFALQGEDAATMVARAREEKRPYALAFVDMRMPPGWDGLTTIVRLWEIDPKLQVVICTAYSDRSWDEIQSSLLARENWLILKKPFDKVEVLQLAQSLTDKWNLDRQAQERESTLERLVRERTDQLRIANQSKANLLANLGHELMTPMNGISGMLELLGQTSLDEEQADCVQTAAGCAERLTELLQMSLTYNQAEAGTLALRKSRFNVGALLASVAAVYRVRADHKGVALRTTVDPQAPAELSAPEPEIRQALLLLVDNAVKFTRQGEVSLSARHAEGCLEIAVADTGIGMSEEHLSTISVPFAQVDGSLTRRFPGVGMGLILARRLAESLGGGLALHSTLGGGTTVRLSVLAQAG